MGFLAPWFLGGLALLGVPILVHLTRRDRAAPSPFPSLMFVRRLPQAVTRKRRLRDLPLLILRALALALLVAAFARPLFDRARAAVAPGAGGRELIVLLDRSYSMGAPGRWARAQDAARQAIATLGPNDRGTVMLFDASSAVAAARTDDRAALRAAIDTTRPGAGATHYAPVLAVVSRLLAQSPLPRREVLLVSDFQRGGWTDTRDVRLPRGAKLTWVDVGGAASPDVAVAGVELRVDSGGSVERVRPVARLVTNGAGEARSVAVTLEVSGRVAQTVTARVGASGVTSVPFDPVPLPSGPTRATIRVAADALPADDAYHMVLSRRQGLRVLLVDGPSRREDPGLFLRRAFDVGDTPRFQVDVATPATVSAASLANHTLVVLHDAPLRGAAARAVADFVRRGGGLLVALGESSAAEGWDAALSGLFPARPGAVVEGDAHLATFERAHPIFAPFAAPHSGDLSAARVLRRRALVPAAGARVLARFDDGTPALVESDVASTRPASDSTTAPGRVLVWASTLDAFWTDLPLQPVFVPFAHGLAVHAAHYAPAPPARVVGETIDPARAIEQAATEFVVDAPSGHHVRVVEPGLVTLTESGFYGVRPAGTPVDVAVPIAANVDPAEADPARIEPTVIAAAAAPDANAPDAAPVAAPETRAERESRQSIWWWLLVAAFLLLAAETVYSNRRRRIAALGMSGAGVEAR